MRHRRRILEIPLESYGIVAFQDSEIKGGSNAYFVPGEKEDYLIDCLSGAPGANLEETLKKYRSSNKKMVILLTHVHADHAGGLSDFTPDSVSVYVHPNGLEALQKGTDRDATMKRVSQHMRIGHFPKAQSLSNSQMFSSLQVLFTPGHSVDSVCFVLQSKNLVFTGDTYYPAKKSELERYCCDSKDRLVASLKLLQDTPFDDLTKYLPGHGDVVVSREDFMKDIAPFFKVKRSKVTIQNCLVCQTPTFLVCGSCHSASYCSRMCQKIQWSSHKQKCTYVGMSFSF